MLLTFDPKKEVGGEVNDDDDDDDEEVACFSLSFSGGVSVFKALVSGACFSTLTALGD